MDLVAPISTALPSKKKLSPKRLRHRQRKPPSRQCSQPSPAPPPTDPQQTKLLWDAVQGMASGAGRRQGNVEGRGRGRGRGANPSTATPDLAVRHRQPLSPPLSYAQPPSIADSSGTRSTARTTGPRNTRFRESILSPRYIIINRTSERPPEPFTHFDTVQPAENNYSSIEGLQHASVWLGLDSEQEEEIVNEYKDMQSRQLWEEEFADYAKETLLKRQRRAHRGGEDGFWRVERLVQAVCPPDEGSYWRTPPVLLETANPAAYQDWSWDVRSDCAYWLSLDGFNQNYSFQVDSKTYVKSDSICPYFTVEFKRTGESDEIAVNQVAATGTMALYNRFCLYQAARALKPRGWKETPQDHLRHYGLTFVGPTYTIWMLRARIAEDGAWNGCDMEKLASGNCSRRAVQVRYLACWINEIHRWGLSVHGMHCKDEIKVLLRGSGVRTSSFSGAGEEE